VGTKVYERPVCWVYPTNVGMIRNLKTGYVSLPFYVMYNDFFEAVHSDKGSLPSAKVWEWLFWQTQLQIYFQGQPLLYRLGQVQILLM